MDNHKGNVFITGASSGIGKATTLELAKRGYRVFSGVRREQDAEALVKELTGSGVIIPIIVDVTKLDDIKKAKMFIQQKIADEGLAAVICNAGILESAPLEIAPLESARRTFDVNYFGVITVIQEFTDLLRKLPGKLLITNSVSGFIGEPLAGHYSPSKHAIEAVAEVLRIELREWKIPVVLVEPGSHKTEMIGAKYLQSKKDLLSEIPEEKKALYKNVLAASEKFAEKQQHHGGPPENVAKLYAKIIPLKNPKARYFIGFDGKVIYFLHKYLPTSLYEKILSSAFGLK